MKEIQQTIKYIDYSCNDCPNVIFEDNDKEGYFKFKRNDWFTYMKKCYGATQG